MRTARRVAVRHPRLAATAAATTIAAVVAATFVAIALASTFHGITVEKSCNSPIAVGADYTCAYRITNSDPDSVKIVSLQDTITNSANAAEPASPVATLSLLSLTVTSGSAVCSGAGLTGDGTTTPYTGAEYCVMQPGAVITTGDYSFYKTTRADYDATAADGHRLNDTAKVEFFDLCNIAPSNCNSTDKQDRTAGSSAVMVDARITISANGIDQVTHAQTFTVLVELNDGSGWAPAPGVDLTNVKLDGVGSITGGTCETGVTGNDGTCTLIVNSDVPGSIHVGTSGTVTIEGVPIVVDTTGYGAHDVQNEKTWVDARITISPNGIDLVNHAQTFTVLVELNDGTGWVPAPGVDLTNLKLDGVGSITGGTCETGLTGTDGTCTLIVNSAVVGSIHVVSSGTVTVSGVGIPVATNGYGAHAIQNEKTWVNPQIAIVKSPDDSNVPKGDTVTFTIKVTNTGDVDLTNVTVTDPLTPSCDKVIGDLAQGASFTYTCTTGALSESFTNVASVTGHPPLGPDVSASDPAPVTVFTPSVPTHPSIGITKLPASQTVVSGTPAPFTIAVTNTGDVTLTNVHVTDALSPGCARTKADIPGLASMAPGVTITYQCSSPAVTADFTNVAIATGTPPSGPDVTASASAVVTTATPVEPLKPKPKPIVVSHRRPKATG